MRILDTIATAQSNLFRSRLRTFLTMLALLIGTFTLAMTTAVGEGVKSYIDQQTKAFAQPDTLYVTAKSTSDSGIQSGKVQEYNPDQEGQKGQRLRDLTTSDISTIKSLTNVVATYPTYSVSTDYIQFGSGKKYVFSVSSLYPESKLTLAAGSLPSVDDQTALLLPYQYLDTLGFSTPADALGKTVTVHLSQESQGNVPTTPLVGKDITLTIRGVLINSLIGQSGYLSYHLVEDLSRYQANDTTPAIQSIMAALTPNLATDKVDTLKQALDKKGYQAESFDDAIASVKNAITTAQLVLDAFAAIALLAATIGIVNTLLMAVFERTKEIGLMKALGMSRSGIFAVFTYEAMSIGFWGGGAGVLVAVGVGSIANRVLSATIFKNLQGFTLLSYPPYYMVAIVAGAMLIGFLAGTLPALRAARLDPIEALRYE